MEYHLYHVLKQSDKPEQAYVFGIDRDEVSRTVELIEMYIFTLVDGVEVKHRIDLTQVMHDVCKKTSGTVPVETINRIKQELERENLEQESTSHLVNGLLMAHEAANRNYKTASDFNTINEYVQYLACKKS